MRRRSRLCMHLRHRRRSCVHPRRRPFTRLLHRLPSFTRRRRHLPSFMRRRRHLPSFMRLRRRHLPSFMRRRHRRQSFGRRQRQDMRQPAVGPACRRARSRKTRGANSAIGRAKRKARLCGRARGVGQPRRSPTGPNRALRRMKHSTTTRARWRTAPCLTLWSKSLSQIQPPSVSLGIAIRASNRALPPIAGSRF